MYSILSSIFREHEAKPQEQIKLLDVETARKYQYLIDIPGNMEP